jgi:2-dehydro-3-deoxyphosphooctonate aldolase (KDO 8-P synthase)
MFPAVAQKPHLRILWVDTTDMTDATDMTHQKDTSDRTGMPHIPGIPHEMRVGDLRIGVGHALTIIAGPCVLESPAVQDRIAETVLTACERLGLAVILKGSFDKANRSSIASARGPGVEEGLRELERLRTTWNVPVTTDIHEIGQAAVAAEVVDLLQVPAFLCRQTDLLLACAATGKPVNVKKGQFLAPDEMRHVLTKLSEGQAAGVMLTERGTFFGYHRLVNDFIGIGDLMQMHRPVCFDVTHSTQLPGAGASSTGGRPDRADLLARAATAAGVDALFIECHPDPAKALSDGSTVQPLDRVGEILRQVAAIRESIGPIGPMGDVSPGSMSSLI